MCRLRLAYPRERQTQSSSSLQFKVVTRPLEFLILIASTGPRLRHRQRPGWEESRPLLGERGREITVDCSFILLSLFSSKVVSFSSVLKSSSIPWKCCWDEAICSPFNSTSFIYSFTCFMKTTKQREAFKLYSCINADFQTWCWTVLISEHRLITKELSVSHMPSGNFAVEALLQMLITECRYSHTLYNNEASQWPAW